jgi:hypothetical protein
MIPVPDNNSRLFVTLAFSIAVWNACSHDSRADMPQVTADAGFQNTTGFFFDDAVGFPAIQLNGNNIVPGSPPTNLQQLVSGASVTSNGPLNNASSLNAKHTGAVSVLPTSSFIEASFGSGSKFEFVPKTTSGAPLVNVNWAVVALMEFDNDGDNDSTAEILAGASSKITDLTNNQIVGDFSGNIKLDTSPPATLTRTGSFNSGGIFNASPGMSGTTLVTFSQTFSITLTPDRPYEIESSHFGLIFQDGFESGDVSAWSMTSPGSWDVSLSSPDPTVTFTVAPEPGSALLALLSAISAVAYGFAAKRNPRRLRSIDVAGR